MDDSLRKELVLDQLKEIDLLAERFEQEYRSGDCPKIEDYVRRHPNLMPHLFMELIDLEFSLLQASGQHPCAEEYLQRFPDNREIVKDILAQLEKQQSTLDQALDTELENIDVPDQVGRYVIRHCLGQGGFGVVYLAHDPQLDRPVALKMPRRERFKNDQQEEAFFLEAQTAAKLNHPGLVSVYDVQREYGRVYIVEEYIQGEDLRVWAHKRRPSFDEVSRLILKICEPMEYLHSHGVTHCDLKLSNVLIDTKGNPHIVDFGLAVHENTQRFRKGEIFGTPYIMAPEQVRGESWQFDGRTDIWAIGVMLYELLVGRPPFTATSYKELFNAILTVQPRPPRQTVSDIPGELESICLKCLAKHMGLRFQSAAQLREAMADTTSYSSHRQSDPRQSRKQKTRTELVTSGCLLLAVGVPATLLLAFKLLRHDMFRDLMKNLFKVLFD